MSKKKQYKDVIGLIHPNSYRHYKSKAICNNPNIVIVDISKCFGLTGWYKGEFKVLKHIDCFVPGRTYPLFGFRPRRILIK